MGFDAVQARAAGYSDDEILNHLTSTRKFDIEGARKSGYQNDEIIQYLAVAPPKAEEQPNAFVEGAEFGTSNEQKGITELKQPDLTRNMPKAMYRAAVTSAITLPEQIKNFGYGMQAKNLLNEQHELEWRKKQNPNADWSRLDEDLARRQQLTEERYAANRPALDVAREYVQEATPEDTNIVQDALISLAQNLPTMIGAGLVAPYSVPLAVGAGVGAGIVQQGSSTVLEVKDKGGTLADAGSPAIVTGMLEGLGAAFSLPKVFSQVPGGLKKLAEAMGYSAAEETVTQFLQDVVKKLDYDPELSWEDMGRNAAVAFLAGAGGGGIGVGAANIVSGTANAINDILVPEGQRILEGEVASQLKSLDQLKATRTELETELETFGSGLPQDEFGTPADNHAMVTGIDEVRQKVLQHGWEIKSFVSHPIPEIAQVAKMSGSGKEVFLDRLDIMQKDAMARTRGLPYDTRDDPVSQAMQSWPASWSGRTSFTYGSENIKAWVESPDPTHDNQVIIADEFWQKAADAVQIAELHGIQQTLQAWIARMMPGVRAVMRPTSPFSGNLGGIAIMNKDTSQIYIEMSPSLFKKPGALAEVLAHEFGHMIVGRFYSQSSELMKKALYRAWRDDLYQAMKGGENLISYQERTAGGIAVQMTGTGPLKDLMRYGDSLGDYARYYTNFPEWTAHQFERALAGDFKGMQNEVKQYIKGAIEQLKAFWSKFVKPIQPNQTFRQFMEYHLTDQAVKNAESRLAETNAHLATIKQARRADMALATLGLTAMRDLIIPGDTSSGPLDPPAPNNMTRQIRSLFRNLFGKQPDDSNFLGDLDKFSRFKQLTASLLYIAKQNSHISELYNPLGTADPVTGSIRHGYVDYVEQWHNARMKQMARSNDSLKLWSKLSSENQGKLSKFILDQTLEGKFFDPLDPAVIAKYELNDVVLDMFQRLRSDFINVIDQLESAIIEEMNVRLQGNPTAPQQIREVMDRFADLRSKPYFPLSRFGRYVVLVRAGRDVTIDGKPYKEGQVIYREHFDTEVERAMQFDAIKGAWRGHHVKKDLVAESLAGYTTIPREVLEAVKDRLGLTDDQRAELDKYLLELAPAQSFSKHLMQRRGIQGFSFDLQRAYASYMVTASNYSAKIRYAQPMRESVQRLHATANAITGDSSARRAIANYMGKHYEYVMAPEAEWAALRAAIAVSYLGFMVKSAMVNLLQVPMVTLPHLSAIHGEVSAIRELGKAYGDVRRMYEQLRPLNATEQNIAERWMIGEQLTPEEQKFIEKWTGFKLDEYDALNKWLAERSALQEAKNQGFIDEALATELVGMSNGGWMSRLTSTTKLGYATRTFSSVAMAPFEMAERMNRRVTFLAAYRLAKQSGLGDNRAFLQAKEAVRISQFEYARYNRPELLRGRKGILMMFMQYQLSMLYFLTGGDKGWWRALIGQLTIGGLLGLPFMQNILDVIDTVVTKITPNDKFDAKAYAKEFLETVVDSPDVFLHGISRYGFGLVPLVDLSGSVSMGRIIPGTDVVKHLAQGQKWDSAATDMVTEVGGATTSLAMRMMQAAGSNDPDVWRRIERGMPLTAGQQVMTALRWWNRGEETDSKGAEIKTFDPNDPYEAAEIVGKALGFQPRSVTEAREDLRLKQDFLNYYMIRRQLLLKILDFAKENNDAEQRREAIEQIHTFNREIPFKSMSIRAADIQRSLKGREKAREMQEATGAASRRGAQFMQELDR